MLSPNLQKPNFPMRGGVGGGGPGPNFQLLDVESKSAKNQIYLCGVGGPGPNFQLLMLSPNLQKPNSPMWGGVGGPGPNFQLLILSPNLAKIPNSLYRGGGGGGGGGRIPSNLWLQSKSGLGWGGVGWPFFFWCWHLMRIRGELKIIWQEFFHPVRVSISQISIYFLKCLPNSHQKIYIYLNILREQIQRET